MSATIPEASGDRSQLGLSNEAKLDLDFIEDELRLPNRVDGYRLGVAVSLRKALEPSAQGVPRTTAYSATGTFDPDGHFRSAILAMRDDHGGRPYALAERLAEAGMRDLRSHLEGGLTLRQYLAGLQASDEQDLQHAEPDGNSRASSA